MTVLSERPLVLFHNPEDVEIVLRILIGEQVAGLTDEMGNVDHRKRIGALEHDRGAHRQIAQGLLGPQHWVRATQATQIENTVSLRLRRHDADIARKRIITLAFSMPESARADPVNPLPSHIPNQR